jgi:hypothetical protein
VELANTLLDGYFSRARVFDLAGQLAGAVAVNESAPDGSSCSMQYSARPT